MNVEICKIHLRLFRVGNEALPPSTDMISLSQYRLEIIRSCISVEFGGTCINFSTWTNRRIEKPGRVI